jgi:hypothetical protein
MRTPERLVRVCGLEVGIAGGHVLQAVMRLLNAHARIPVAARRRSGA